MIGKTLGHYEIIGLLGKGGMGEVYRAHDTTLNREVAVKVLPAAFSHDLERVASFEREATTLAKLQHTNIATIYGFEEDQDQRFLVMELVDGEELAERLERGPIPPEEALTLAAQIAEGLEVAHGLGIVHRDLKPANIKITPTGDVKILDFGLARAYADEPDGGSTMEIAHSPTLTAAMTQAGVILGTAAYMSPEQARGRSVDKQADVWSFGVVFYEMLTADRLFGGETVSDSIGAILHRDPDLTQLPLVPKQVHTLLRRCLARDKKQRLRDIGDARLELEDAIAARIATKSSDRGMRQRAPWLVSGLLVVLVAALGWVAITRSPESLLKVTTLGLSREQAIDLAVFDNAWPRLKFSPDGRQVVYLGGENFELFRRDIGSFESVVIPGTEGASIFTFSPDGRWLAFVSGSKLWKVALSGGAPVEICDTAGGPGLAWGQGTLYFIQGNGGGLLSVPDTGGQPQAVSTLNDEREETSHRWPHVLPGDKHLLVTIKTARIATFDDALIGLLSLETGEMKVLITGGTQAQYLASGHIVYGRDDQLFAVPFDLASLSVQGTPTRVLDHVSTVDVNGCTQYSLSDDGDLAYLLAGQNQAAVTKAWVYLSGKVSALDVIDPFAFDAALSPDGGRVSTTVAAANDKIFVYDFQRQTMTRLSNTPGNDGNSLWSPDGRMIAYQNDRNGSADLFLIPADGSAPARRILDSPLDEFPNSWSPDGTRILFTRVDAGGRPEICIMPTDGSEEPSVLIATEHSTWNPRVSPNGRWVAYVSDSSGEGNVYVRPFEAAGSPIRVSITGGDTPQWSPDGRTLYFTVEQRVMSVSITASPTLAAGSPEVAMELGATIFGDPALAPDGERFLVTQSDAQVRRQFGIRVIFDWTDRLKELKPTRRP